MSIKLSLECAALRAERDALKAQMETVAKGSFDATAVMAEENRLLRDQLGQARTDVAKLVEKWREEADNTPSRVNDFKAITLCYCAEQLESALKGIPPKP